MIIKEFFQKQFPAHTMHFSPRFFPRTDIFLHIYITTNAAHMQFCIPCIST